MMVSSGLGACTLGRALVFWSLEEEAESLGAFGSLQAAFELRCRIGLFTCLGMGPY